MLMKKKLKISVAVLGCMLVFGVGFTLLTPKEERVERVYQHEQDVLADPSVGTTEMNSEGTIDMSFETHLPLVILEVNEDDIKNIYSLTEDNVRVYTDENDTNPWTDVKISMIDNQNGTPNALTDEPTFENEGWIKLRGMSSRYFAKKQYGIKLMDGDEELEVPLLGMDSDEDWVLTNSELDATGIRNYLAMNIGGQIFPYTSEVRFCEVVMKNGDDYEYKGLYMLTEKTKQGEGHIDIEDFDEDAVSLSYIMCRDRYDDTSLMLSTWASDQQLCYGYFTLQYPKAEDISADGITRIEDEISKIEQILYSEDPEVFLTYDQYLDVDSFVDYFIINEFFMNYDAGNNSTYYYKTGDGKLAIGPLWDYDNCLDNYSMAVGGEAWIGFVERPWFDKLVQDPVFQQKLVARYQELRQGILSEEYLNQFIDDTIAYLGNARTRDWNRWREDYEAEHMLHIAEHGEGFMIDRNRETLEEELLRMKDMMHLHGTWMDQYLEDFLLDYAVEEFDTGSVELRSTIAVLAILAFLCMLTLVTRKLKGEVR